MKLKYLLFYFCFIALSVYAQEIKTKLIITANTEGAYIFVEGKFEGRGKLEINLPAGEYQICVKESLIKWSGAEVTGKVIITGTENKIEKYYSLEKSHLLNSQPQNAQVLSRDSLIGYTPMFINSEVKNVTFLKENYGPLNVNLSSTGKNNFDLGSPVNGHNKSFIQTTWFKVLIGTAVVLGAVAAYYKVLADRKYDDYTSGVSPGILSEVNRYDTISGVALGALQVNFGILLYFLLSE